MIYINIHRGNIIVNEKVMKASQIKDFLEKNFEDLNVIETWGETAFFYNKDRRKKRGSYFCTIKEKDGENDKASNLSRDDIYRLNFCLSKEKFIEIFEQKFNRPAKGGIVSNEIDFTKTNILLPHPVYAWMNWVCILNPSKEKFTEILPLIEESYLLAKKRF